MSGHMRQISENNTEKSRDLMIANGENEYIFFRRWGFQKVEASIRRFFKKGKKGNFMCAKNGRWQFYIKGQTLCRYFASPIRSIMQLVVPVKLRKEDLQTSHDSIFIGHLGTTKTLTRIQSQFYWQVFPDM